MRDEALRMALEAAYLAGFNASGEGYNGEYPFEHKGKNCTDDPIWCKDRDNELTAIKQALAAPVQEPVADKRFELIGHADLGINNIYIFNGYGEEVPEGRTPLYAGYTTPSAQPATEDFSAVQPAVPDAFGTREGEHPQYIQGWNDCRAEMLKGNHEPV
jgi:hypothetical protein